ncbi:hypothetical protein JCM11641_000640 [Rhodosporidiobolus odoratus]
MLKAKAKAAATAAAQKRKAAAAAAAQQEAAAQQAAAAASGVGLQSTTRSGRGLRPQVTLNVRNLNARFITEYWVDSASSILAPGGSIQRVGYDQAAFEEAVRVIIFGNEPSEGFELSQAGLIEEKKVIEEEKKGKEEKEDGYKTNKEDLAVILENLSVPSALAAQTLRQHKGNLEEALRDLSSPTPAVAA